MTRYFTETHEYIDIDGDIATVGITKHAAEQLGDVVFVEHPETDITVEKGQPLSVVESTKAASEVYAPLSGTVVEVNNDIVDNPGLVSEDSENKAWFFKIKMSNKSEADALLSADAYKEIAG